MWRILVETSAEFDQRNGGVEIMKALLHQMNKQL